MVAPALIMLFYGSPCAMTAMTAETMCQQMCASRPNLHISSAILSASPTSLSDVVADVVTAGAEEIVLTPMSLAYTVEPDHATLDAWNILKKKFPQISTIISRPIGPATELLPLLDLRLRNALSAAHVQELDSLILALPQHGDIRGSSLIARRARQWSSHHNLPVTVCTADSPTSVNSCIKQLYDSGRRAPAVGSFFLEADDRYTMLRDEALNNGVRAVSLPFGPDLRFLDIIMSRYSYAAMNLLDFPTL